MDLITFPMIPIKTQIYPFSVKIHPIKVISDSCSRICFRTHFTYFTSEMHELFHSSMLNPKNLNFTCVQYYFTSYMNCPF